MRPVTAAHTYTATRGSLPSEILDLIKRPAWWRRASCRGKPSSWWFPGREDGEAGDRAREICRTCPVQAECLIAAVQLEEAGEAVVGIFGGTSERDRRRMRRERAS